MYKRKAKILTKNISTNGQFPIRFPTGKHKSTSKLKFLQENDEYKQPLQQQQQQQQFPQFPQQQQQFPQQQQQQFTQSQFSYQQELEQTRQELEQTRQELEQTRQELEQTRQELEQTRHKLEQQMEQEEKLEKLDLKEWLTSETKKQNSEMVDKIQKALKKVDSYVDGELKKQHDYVAKFDKTLQTVQQQIIEHVENFENLKIMTTALKQSQDKYFVSNNQWVLATAKKEEKLFTTTFQETKHRVLKDELVCLNFPLIEEEKQTFVQIKRVFENGIPQIFLVEFTDNFENFCFSGPIQLTSSNASDTTDIP